MREIKFRGMDIHGSWHYGLLAKPLAGNYKDSTFISNSMGMPLGFEVRPETVGEYTGLKDKNGKEIYEGDIVTDFAKDNIIWDDSTIILSTPYGIAEYNAPYYNVKQIKTGSIKNLKTGKIGELYLNFYDGLYVWSNDTEIIGNIYEQPELERI